MKRLLCLEQNLLFIPGNQFELLLVKAAMAVINENGDQERNFFYINRKYAGNAHAFNYIFEWHLFNEQRIN